MTDSFSNPTSNAPGLLETAKHRGRELTVSTAADPSYRSLRSPQDLYTCKKQCSLSVLSRRKMRTKHVLGE